MNILLVVFSSLLLLTNYAKDHNNKNEETVHIKNKALKASVVSVTTSGGSENYTFSVGISSPDTGCEQYANWWEVITEDGNTLIYRRILGHSHIKEQPFIRSGGTVSITENQIVIIRAHMNTSGYGTTVFKGSVSAGFIETVVDADFANDLAKQQPLPGNCTS